MLSCSVLSWPVHACQPHSANQSFGHIRSPGWCRSITNPLTKHLTSPYARKLVAAMAQGRSSVTVRALTEQAIRHFPLYGRAAQGRLNRKVRDAARRAAEADPERLGYGRATGVTEERVAILRSPETFDRRGRTQGYQAVWAGRASRPRRPSEVPGQIDLFSELDEAERVATEEESDNSTEGHGEQS